MHSADGPCGARSTRNGTHNLMQQWTRLFYKVQDSFSECLSYGPFPRGPTLILVSLRCCDKNTLTKISLERKGFISVYRSHSLLLRETQAAGPDLCRNCKAGLFVIQCNITSDWGRKKRVLLLPVSITSSCPASFLMQPKSIFPGNGATHSGLESLRQPPTAMPRGKSGKSLT